MEASDGREHWLRRFLRRAFNLSGLALIGLNLLALVGFVARDRSVLPALLLYFPLLPLGLASLLFALACRGRSVKGPRLILATVGFAAVTCSGLTMIGRGPEAAPTTGAMPGGEVKFLHWNVLWGGRPRTDASWASIEDAILRQGPDVVVLSEAPPDARLDSLERRLGAGWSSARVEHDPGKPYWYKLVALSRWPVLRGQMVPIRNGTAVEVQVKRPGRPIRLLIVDGQSKITQLRTPMLLDVANACQRASEAGTPFDIVVGDFNAVERSLGFEELRSVAGGYVLASWSSTGWRGTWPVPVPLYDIDHVWVRVGGRIVSCALFANPASDHRGQLVRLMLPASSSGGGAEGEASVPDHAVQRNPSSSERQSRSNFDPRAGEESPSLLDEYQGRRPDPVHACVLAGPPFPEGLRWRPNTPGPARASISGTRGPGSGLNSAARRG
jgi:endonuclease/exonuclease/phosphatase (EEP) superfamily protein YafD